MKRLISSVSLLALTHGGQYEVFGGSSSSSAKTSSNSESDFNTIAKSLNSESQRSDSKDRDLSDTVTESESSESDAYKRQNRKHKSESDSDTPFKGQPQPQATQVNKVSPLDTGQKLKGDSIKNRNLSKFIGPQIPTLEDIKNIDQSSNRNQKLPTQQDQNHPNSHSESESDPSKESKYTHYGVLKSELPIQPRSEINLRYDGQFGEKGNIRRAGGLEEAIYDKQIQRKLAESDPASRRHLGTQAGNGEWSWLEGNVNFKTQVQVEGIGISTYQVASTARVADAGNDLILIACTEYSVYDKITIDLTNQHTWSVDWPTGFYNPSLKALSGDLTSREQCQDGQGKDVRLGLIDPFGSESHMASGDYANNTKLFQLGVVSGEEWKMRGENQPFAFMHGGRYKICISPEGEFGQRSTSVTLTSAPLFVDFLVYGVKSTCTGQSCLKYERWECWYSPLQDESVNCEFSFSGSKYRTGWLLFMGTSTISKMTWTDLMDDETYESTTGYVNSSATQKECRLSQAVTSIFDQQKFGQPTITMDTGINPTVMPEIAHTARGPYSMRLCYCPNYARTTGTACAQWDEYIQSWGVLYYWRMNICDYSNVMTEECRQNPALRVIPQIKFSLRLDCPPAGGCYRNNNNRIMIIDVQGLNNNDKNSWEETSGCATVQSESSYVDWTNFLSSPSTKVVPAPGDKSNLDGGDREDFKVFGTDSQAQIDLNSGGKLDVCYCHTPPDAEQTNICTSPGPHWFRVGHFKTANVILASRAYDDNLAPKLIRYRGLAGTVIFYGGQRTPEYTPNAIDVNNINLFAMWGDGQRYSGKTLMKLVPYDNVKWVSVGGVMKTLEETYMYDKKDVSYTAKVDQMNSQCNLADHSAMASHVIDTQYSNSAIFQSAIPHNPNTAYTYYPFLGDLSATGYTTAATHLTLKTSGAHAICYCGVPLGDPLTGAAAGCTRGWKFATYLFVSGPSGGQHWEFPLETVNSIQLVGHGFNTHDIIRIIPNGQSCLSTDGDADSPNTVLNTYKTGCHSVDALGCRTGLGCPSVDGSDCATASNTANSNVGSYVRVQPTTKTHIYPEMGLYALSAAYSDDEITVFELTGNVQYSELKEGDTILIDKNDIIFEHEDTGTIKTITDWRYDQRMREAASMLTNNWHLEDTNFDPNHGDHLSQRIGWKVSYYHNPLITSNFKARFISIPFGFTKYFGRYKDSNNNFFQRRYPYKVTFRDANGDWMKTNTATTNVEIKGIALTTPTTAPLTVCWGRLESGGTVPKFYTDAGTLLFKDPPSMKSATVSLTSSAEEENAPLLISFETSSATSTAIEYKKYAIGYTQKLVLRWRDLDRVEPQRHEDHAPAQKPRSLISEGVMEKDASQNICGFLFTEMWSNDVEGFPLPEKCYYSRKYRDAPSAGGGQNWLWMDVTIVFPRSTGIKHICVDKTDNTKFIDCQYMIALNHKLGQGLPGGTNVLDLFVKCDRCLPYNRDVYLEKGQATVTIPSITGNSQQPGDGNSPTISEFKVPSPQLQPSYTAEALDLTTNQVITAQITAAAAPQKITASSILRFYLYPLLQWAVPATFCSLLCMDYTIGQNTYTCGPPNTPNAPLTTVILPLSPLLPARRNMIKATFPSVMTDPISDDIKHSLQISSLQFPTTGFFNVRMGLQLTTPDDEKPVFTTSNGLFYKLPDAIESSARLIVNDATGYGPRPFALQTNNYAYIRFQLGVPMYHNGDGESAWIEVLAPVYTYLKFKCKVTGDGKAPSNLMPFYDFDGDGYLDSNYGGLGTGIHEGEWFSGGESGSGPNGVGAISENTCKYLMKKNMFIPVHSVFYVMLNLDNPEAAWPKSGVGNIWRMKLYGKGERRTEGGMAFGLEGDNKKGLLFNPQGGAVLNEDVWNPPNRPRLWYENIGVVNSLINPVAAPTNFVISTVERPQTSEVYVFFQAATDIGRNGYLKLRAPCGYDFGNQVVGDKHKCKFGHLPRYYYDYLDSAVPQVHNLTNPLSCYASNVVEQCGGGQTTFCMATVRLGDRIGMDLETNIKNYYGFTMMTTHSHTFTYEEGISGSGYGGRAVRNTEEWKLYVADHNNWVVDGTMETLYQNPTRVPASQTRIADGAFGLYEGNFQAMGALAITVYGLLPSSYDGDLAGHWISVDGFEVKTELTNVNFRFISPSGYTFVNDPQIYYQDLPRNAAVGRAPFGCKDDSKSIDAYTQLRFTECNFAAETSYGFAIKATIPDFSPSYGMNSFYMEVGFLGTKVNECAVVGQVGPNSMNGPCRDTADMSITRVMASKFDAQLIQSLRACTISYTTRRHTADNVLTITFFLVTALTHVGNGIRIEGEGKNAEFQFICDEYGVDEKGEPILILRNIHADFSGGSNDAGSSAAVGSQQGTIPAAYIQDSLDPPDGLFYRRFPPDYECDASTVGLLKFAVKTRTFKSGYYRFTVPVMNLPYSSASRDTFRFSTWQDNMKEDWNKNPMDIGVTTFGFELLSQMMESRLVKFSSSGTLQGVELEDQVRKAIGRDDRPGYPNAPQPNSILFAMKLKDTPNVKDTGNFRIYAPKGFIIANDCLDKFETDWTKILGPYAKDGYHCMPDWQTNCGPEMYPNCVASPANPRCFAMQMNTEKIYETYIFEKWPDVAKPERCEGYGNTAFLTVPVGLDDSVLYLFKLTVDSNPPFQPEDNQWRFEFAAEASVLFSSFDLQTVSDLTITPVSLARRSSNLADAFANPVEFSFQPYQIVPAKKSDEQFGGSLTVEQPGGYDFVYQVARRRVDEESGWGGYFEEEGEEYYKTFEVERDAKYERQLDELLDKVDKVSEEIIQSKTKSESDSESAPDNWHSSPTKRTGGKDQLRRRREIRKKYLKEKARRLKEQREEKKKAQIDNQRRNQQGLEELKKDWSEYETEEHWNAEGGRYKVVGKESDTDSDLYYGKRNLLSKSMSSAKSKFDDEDSEDDDDTYDSITKNIANSIRSNYMSQKSSESDPELHSVYQSRYLRQNTMHAFMSQQQQQQSPKLNNHNYKSSNPNKNIIGSQGGAFPHQTTLPEFSYRMTDLYEELDDLDLELLREMEIDGEIDGDGELVEEVYSELLDEKNVNLDKDKDKKLKKSKRKMKSKKSKDSKDLLKPQYEDVAESETDYTGDLDLLEGAPSATKAEYESNSKNRNLRVITDPKSGKKRYRKIHQKYLESRRSRSKHPRLSRAARKNQLRRLLTKTCQIDLRTQDGTTQMLLGSDITCEILPDGTLEARIIAKDKQIINTKVWLLTVYVYNRANTVTSVESAGSFSIRTFNTEGDLLDFARIDGFNVINILNLWIVKNTASVYKGTAIVAGVEFIASFPDSLITNDAVDIIAPLGFDLRVEGTAGQCNNFKWSSGYNILPPEIAPLCSCPESWKLNGIQRCGMQFVMSTGTNTATNTIVEEIVAMNTELRFQVDTKNPLKVHSQLGNNWLAYHRRKISQYYDIEGNLIPVYNDRSTHAFKSWMVLPQLSNVLINIVGNYQAAEAYTDVQFSFLPVQNAVTLWAEVTDPLAFRFESCSMDPPYVVDAFSKGPILVVNSIGAQSGIQLSFIVKNVKLGEIGGRTKWNLRTYAVELINGQMQGPNDFRDERLEFQGFILPGKLDVSKDPEKLLITDYMQSPSVYPTESLFPAREGELTNADISFSVSQHVPNRGVLVITCVGVRPYTIEIDGFYLAQEGIPIKTVVTKSVDPRITVVESAPVVVPATTAAPDGGDGNTNTDTSNGDTMSTRRRGLDQDLRNGVYGPKRMLQATAPANAATNVIEGKIQAVLNEDGSTDLGSFALVPLKITKLRFRCIPKIGNSKWRLDTFASPADSQLVIINTQVQDPNTGDMVTQSTLGTAGLPSNTNDGTEEPFLPVYRLGVVGAVIQDRRPPAALIDVSFRIDPVGASVRRVIIIAPPTFKFPTICGTNCEPYQTIGPEKRKSIKIEDPQGYALTAGNLEDVRFKVNTPEVSPNVLTWFVQTEFGSAVGGWRTTGWETNSGFGVRKMQQGNFVYAPRKGLQGSLLYIGFQVLVPGGTMIKVLPPVLYEVYCSVMPLSNDPALYPISLPGAPQRMPECKDSPMTLTLAEPLQEGYYAFMIGIDVPVQSAAAISGAANQESSGSGGGPGVDNTNMFSIVILKLMAPEVTSVASVTTPIPGQALSQAEQNAISQSLQPQERVLEANYEIPVIEPLQELEACCATMGWMTIPVPGATVNVHIGITFEADVRGVAALMVALPPNYKHLIKDAADAKNLNKFFPVAPAGTWIDFSMQNAIKIYVDQENSKLPFCAENFPEGLYGVSLICEGTYKFEFPIQIPSLTELPSANAWTLSVCLEATCNPEDMDYPTAAYTFPMPGFNMGDQPTAYMPSGGGRRYYSQRNIIIVVLLLGIMTMMSTLNQYTNSLRGKQGLSINNVVEMNV